VSVSKSEFATDWTTYNARWFPDSPALEQVEDGRKLSWRQLDDRVGRLAGALAASCGITKGQRVAVLAENDIRLFDLQFACMRLGAVLVPLNWRLAPAELRTLCASSRPSLLVHDEQWADTAVGVAEAADIKHVASWGVAGAEFDIDALIEAGPGYRARREHLLADPTHILYTSGTTGLPKGAVSTFGTLTGAAANVESLTRMTGPGTRQFNPLPLFHAAGLNAFANPILYGGGAVTVARRFDPEQVMRLIGDPANGFSHFTAMPTMYEFIAKLDRISAADFSYIRQCHVGGTLAREYVEFFDDLGLPIQQGYGGTEVGTYASFMPRDAVRRKHGSCGKTLRGIHMRLVAPGTDVDVAPGQVGEAWICGPSVTPGYWNSATEACEPFPDGWYHSGDALRQDEDGFHYVVDRYKEMFKSGGESVFPAEVERVLAGHPDVEEVAVIPVPDERWGHIGLAIVVTAGDAQLDSDALASFCREHLARYKVPKQFVVTGSLPRNATGKVIKADLKGQFAPRG
jgi:fatty-acyl-CoA synthase